MDKNIRINYVMIYNFYLARRYNKIRFVVFLVRVIKIKRQNFTK